MPIRLGVFCRFNKQNLQPQGFQVFVVFFLTFKKTIKPFYQKLLDWQRYNEITNIFTSPTLSKYIWLSKLLSSKRVRVIIRNHLVSLGKAFLFYFPERKKTNDSHSLETNLAGQVISNPFLASNWKEDFNKLSLDRPLKLFCWQ